MAIPNETIDERPVSGVFTGGRMFYLANNVVYYSQVMEGENVSLIAKCYSKNDPTAEQLSDILATDGGTIALNEASKGVLIGEVPNGVIVFCTNGVWSITGPDSGFSATNFKVTRITNRGATGKQNIVQVGDIYYYWGEDAIYVVQPNEFGVLKANNLTEDSIETFYKDISVKAREYAHGFYNTKTNNIEWYYSDEDYSDSSTIYFAHNKGLFYNVRTGGFFKMDYRNATQLGDEDPTFFLVGGIDLSRILDDGEWYISASQAYPISGDAIYTAYIGQRSNATGYLDWNEEDIPTAYLETGYETLGKPSNNKEAPYITTHFKQTEENWISDGGDGFILDNQSGCQLQSKWDWNNSDANGKWGPQHQAYRFKRLYTPSGAEPFDSGEQVITTKNKVKGRGKALSLRFEQEFGKDMQLLGYTVQWSMSARI